MTRHAHDSTDGELPLRIERALAASATTSAGHATVWATASAMGRQAASFGGLLILARLLPPADFGLYAIIASVSLFGLIFIEMGLGAAVVTDRHLTAVRLETALWLNAMAACLCFILVLALSVPLSRLYGDPRLVALLAISALTFLFSLSTIQLALLERSLQFRWIFFVEVSGAVAGQLGAIALAKAGYGVTSLACIGPITAFVTAVLTWVSLPWRPRLSFRSSDAKALWNFSKHLLLFNSINYWARNIDNLLLPLAAPKAAVGYYSRAYSLMMLPLQQISTVIARVALPVMVRARASRGSVGDSWLEACRASWTLGLPVGVALGVGAHQVVTTLLGPAWGGAAPLVAILAVAIAPQLVTRTSGVAYQAVGRPDLQLRFGIICTLITIGGVCAGLHWGAEGVAVGVTASYYCHLLVVLVDLPPRLQLSAWAVVRSLLPALIWGCAALLAAKVCSNALASQAGWVSLAGVIGTVAAVYGVGLLITYRTGWSRLILR